MKTDHGKTKGWRGISFVLVIGLGVVSVFFPIVAGAQTSASNAIVPTAPVSGYALAWNDEFNGSAIDSARWSYRTDSKHLSTQKPDNVSLKDGLLRLTLKKETANNKNYTGAGIVSQSAFKYAYYEARAKMPAGAGWHTSFWLMKHDGSGTTDFQMAAQGIVVAQNESVDHASYAVKVDKYQEPAACYGFLRLPAPDLSADFHVFGCEFTAETINFFMDGVLVETVDTTKFTHSDQNVWLSSIASHMGNTPKVDDSALPQESLFDYVRVFTKANPAAPLKRD